MKANLLRLAILAILAGSGYAQEKMSGQPATMAAPDSKTTGSQESAGQGQGQQHMMQQPTDSEHMNNMDDTKKDHKKKKMKMKKHDGTSHDPVEQYDPMKGNWG